MQLRVNLGPVWGHIRVTLALFFGIHGWRWATFGSLWGHFGHMMGIYAARVGPEREKIEKVWRFRADPLTISRGPQSSARPAPPNDQQHPERPAESHQSPPSDQSITTLHERAECTSQIGLCGSFLLFPIEVSTRTARWCGNGLYRTVPHGSVWCLRWHATS